MDSRDYPEAYLTDELESYGTRNHAIDKAAVCIKKLQAENAALKAELAAAQDDVVAWKYEADGFRRNRDALSAELLAAQAKIDSLMFEYCPDEMTPEQISEWGKWQRPIDSDKQAAIDEAVKEKTEC